MADRWLVLFCLVCTLFIIRYQYLQMCRDVRFNEYLRKFNKSYSGPEYMRRLQYFERSLEDIKKLNSREHGTGALHGLTRFSDWSDDELESMYGLGRGEHKLTSDCMTIRNNCSSYQDSGKANLTASYRNNLPDKFDWRQRGVIGPVLDQKMCNGCWAFGIIGVMESMAVIQGYGYRRLSIQQLLDCSTATGQCNGGNIDLALAWLCMLKVRVTTEKRYPLMLVNHQCRMTPTEGRRLSSFAIACNVSEHDLLSRVVEGPVLSVVHARPWMNYVSGIIQRNCADHVNGIVHVVQIVGYDRTAPVPYYIVKNSYGTDFGENGYVRVALEGNVCGIKNHIGYLYVAKD